MGDIQLSDGKVLNNVRLGRFGSLSEGAEIAYKHKLEQKRSNKRYYCDYGLYYNILLYTKEEIIIRWNGSYCETRKIGKVACIEMPRCFRKYSGQLRYKDIIIERVESNKDRNSLIIYGKCAT